MRAPLLTTVSVIFTIDDGNCQWHLARVRINSRTMDLNQLLDPASLRSELVAIAIIVLALLLILFVNRKRLRVRLRGWRTRRCLDRIGSEQIRNLVCADGLDGYFHIDRLALVGDAILLISYKAYSGNIYCAEHISDWTQVIGQQSFKFANPLFELENQVTALRQICGNASLYGYLFFDYSAAFPKGHPDSVLTPNHIPDGFLNENCSAANAEIQRAWEALKMHQREASGVPGVGVKT